MLNIDFLEYIVEFAKTQNLSRTGEKLHISQSALTRAMQKIEQHVGVPLFIRTGNKITLSETGKKFVELAKAFLSAENEMIDKTREFYDASLKISVGAVTIGAMLKFGGAMYSAFRDKNIISKIAEASDLEKGLADGAFDILFTPELPKNDEWGCVFAFLERLYAVVPKKHFVAGMTDGVRFSEIDRQSFLIADDLGVWDKIIRKNLPRSVFYSQSVEELENQINASTIPSFATDVTLNLRQTKERIYIPILDDAAKMDVYMVYKKENAEKLRPFIEMISKQK